MSANGGRAVRAGRLAAQDCEIISVEHPAIIQNLDRGLLSLGGESEINKFLDYSRNPGLRSMHVSLRPEDIFATKLSSGYVKTNNLLIKISLPRRTGRKRKRGSTGAFIQDPDHIQTTTPDRVDASTLSRSLRDNPERFSVRTVGKINDTYRYRSIGSFQYATVSNPIFKKMNDTLLSSDYEEMRSFVLDASQALDPKLEVQPPPVIGFSEIPFPFNYRQNINVKVLVDEHGTTQSFNSDRKHSVPITYVAHDVDTVPVDPPASLPPEKSLDTQIQSLIKTLRQELEKRPVMTTRVQISLTQCHSYSKLRKALPYLGYLFRGGPFKDALVRYGVDPRRDPKYRVYQLVSIQIQEPDKATKWYGPVGSKKDNNSIKYVFNGKELYTDSKTWQVCDVVDPVLRKIVENCTISEIFDLTTSGWYKSGTWAIYRTILKDKAESLVQGNPRSDGFYEKTIVGWPDDIEDRSRDVTLRTGIDPDSIALQSRARNLARLGEQQAKKLNQQLTSGLEIVYDNDSLDSGSEVGDYATLDESGDEDEEEEL